MVAARIDPGSVAVDPWGTFAYVASIGDSYGIDCCTNVSMYTIDATTGALASIGGIAPGSLTSSIAIRRLQDSV